MALALDINVTAAGSLTKVLGALTGSLKPTVAQVFALTNGIGLDQCDQFYYSRPTIAGSATLSLDVATGGGLLNLYGDAFVIAKLKVLIVKTSLALCPNIINLVRPTAGVPFMLAAADGEPMHPGGITIKIWPTLAGIPVTATTADLIDLVNTTTGSVQPEIFIAGASA